MTCSFPHTTAHPFWRLDTALTTPFSQEQELSLQNICSGKIQSSLDHQRTDKWTMSFVHSTLDTFKLSTFAALHIVFKLLPGTSQPWFFYASYTLRWIDTFVYKKCFKRVAHCWSLFFLSSMHRKEASLFLKPGLRQSKSSLGLWIFLLSSYMAAASSNGWLLITLLLTHVQRAMNWNHKPQAACS